jgi:hypothetical protein
MLKNNESLSWELVILWSTSLQLKGARVKACCDWLNKTRSFEPSLCAKSAYQTHDE